MVKTNCYTPSLILPLKLGEDIMVKDSHPILGVEKSGGIKIIGI